MSFLLMKPISLRPAMAAVLAVVAVAVASFDVAAQQTPPARIAILGIQRVLLESAAAIDIKAQVDQRRQSYQEERNKQEQELRALVQELKRQNTILAPEAWTRKRHEFENRVTEIELVTEARRRELDQAYDYGMKEVRSTLTIIVAELAKERGFNLVLQQARIVIFDSALNITDEALRRLNARLPSVKVPLIQN